MKMQAEVTITLSKDELDYLLDELTTRAPSNLYFKLADAWPVAVMTQSFIDQLEAKK